MAKGSKPAPSLGKGAKCGSMIKGSKKTLSVSGPSSMISKKA